MSKTQFYQIETSYDYFKKMHNRRMDVSDFYDWLRKHNLEEIKTGQLEEDNIWNNWVNGCLAPTMEEAWIRADRPYYKLYPNIVDIFFNTQANISSELVKLPHLAFAVKFPIGKDAIYFDYKGKNYLDYMLVGITYQSEIPYKSKIAMKLKAVDCYNSQEFADFVKESYAKVSETLIGADRFSFNNCRLHAFLTISCNYFNIDLKEDMFNVLNVRLDEGCLETNMKCIGHEVPMFEQCCRAALGVMFCATGAHKVLEYDVIERHLEAYKKCKDEKQRRNYEHKAKKTGKYGWNIGRDGTPLELPKGLFNSPSDGTGNHKLTVSFTRGGHYRNQRCGQGRRQQKSIWIKTMTVRADLPPKKFS